MYGRPGQQLRTGAPLRRKIDGQGGQFGFHGLRDCGQSRRAHRLQPGVLSELLGDKDPARAGRAMQAMMKMGKIDIQQLRDAAAGL